MILEEWKGNKRLTKNKLLQRRLKKQEIVREPTASSVVFRRNQQGEVEFLLYQDALDRWTIPKGHIEQGDTAQATARREIGEETGLKNLEFHSWLGKPPMQFRYRTILNSMPTMLRR